MMRIQNNNYTKTTVNKIITKAEINTRDNKIRKNVYLLSHMLFKDDSVFSTWYKIRKNVYLLSHYIKDISLIWYAYCIDLSIFWFEVFLYNTISSVREEHPQCCHEDILQDYLTTKNNLQKQIMLLKTMSVKRI